MSSTRSPEMTIGTSFVVESHSSITGTVTDTPVAAGKIAEEVAPVRIGPSVQGLEFRRLCYTPVSPKPPRGMDVRSQDIE